MSKRLMLLVSLTAATAAVGSVMDEAKFWWKFDQGGTDGAVVQTSEIHDCRDASVGEATRVCGPSGGPIWTNMTVRLPYQQKDVECTALNIQVVPNAAGTQIRPSMVDIPNGHVHSDTVTFFARICAGEQLYTGTVDRFLYNNAFRWGSTKGDSYGNLYNDAAVNKNGEVVDSAGNLIAGCSADLDKGIVTDGYGNQIEVDVSVLLTIASPPGSVEGDGDDDTIWAGAVVPEPEEEEAMNL